MTDIHLTRARRDFLGAVGRGKVVRNEAGHPFLRRFRGFNHRCDKDVRLFEAAGLIELGPDGSTYRLTAAGEALLAGTS
jgi:hypothetical protein